MYIRKTPMAAKSAMGDFRHGLDDFDEQAFVSRQQFRAALALELFAIGRFRTFRQHLKL
jgi:hypothetical protein